MEYYKSDTYRQIINPGQTDKKKPWAYGQRRNDGHKNKYKLGTYGQMV